MSLEADMYLNDFNDNLDIVNDMNRHYKDAIGYLNNTEDLYNSYSSKKNELKQSKNKIYGEIDLNDRKGYYQNQTQENLEFWHSVFWYIYYLLVIVLILGFFFDKSGRSRVKKIFIAVFAFFFPFLIRLYQKVKHHIYEKYLKRFVG
jgi:lipopolysaccharide export LptBFGC system permease protein LptF